MVEKSEGGPTPDIRTTRPGLTGFHSVGIGPILRMFQIPGVFNGDLFQISGGELYEYTVLLGEVTYGINPRIVSANNQLVIVSGGTLYVYPLGGPLTTVQFFDDGVSPLPSFSSVAVLYNIFIFTVAGSNQFFFSSVGDATIINAANFSAAQTSPDPIIEVQVLAEEIYFFKPKAVEIWDYTGSLTAPFALSQGRTYSRGCASQGTVVTNMDNGLFWVGDDMSVYRSGNVPEKISTPYIDDRLQYAGANGIAEATAYYLGIEGHSFYILNLPSINTTFAYDASVKEWSVWGSYNPYDADPTLYLGYCSAGQTSTELFIGSYKDGNVYLVDSYNYTDAGQTLSCVVAGAILMDSDKIRCNNVSIQCVRGLGSYVQSAIVKMRYSDDGGHTWSSWLQGQIGYTGDYSWKATWRYLGTMHQPGRYFEWCASDNVPFTIESATFNEGRV